MNNSAQAFLNPPARAERDIVDLHEFLIVEDHLHPLREYWCTLKRHAWLILACAAAAILGAALYTFTRPLLYTADTTLLIERKAPQFLKLQDARPEINDYDFANEFQKTQHEILKSRSLAERVIQREGLQNHYLFKSGKDAKGAHPGLISSTWARLKRRVARFLPGEAKVAAPQSAAN